MVLEKTLGSPLDSTEIQLVHPKGNQSWIFIGRTDAKAEALILWPPGVKSQLTGKDPDAGKDWGQKGKRTTEDEMVGWHHWLNGHEFGHTLGDGEGQGNLVCCSPWGQTQRVRYNLVTEQQYSDVLIFQIDSFSSFLRQKPKRFFWYLPWESCCASGDIVPFPLPWLVPLLFLALRIVCAELPPFRQL